jgi:hypothetical protein
MWAHTRGGGCKDWRRSHWQNCPLAHPVPHRPAGPGLTEVPRHGTQATQLLPTPHDSIYDQDCASAFVAGRRAIAPEGGSPTPSLGQGKVCRGPGSAASGGTGSLLETTLTKQVLRTFCIPRNYHDKNSADLHRSPGGGTHTQPTPCRPFLALVLLGAVMTTLRCWNLEGQPGQAQGG